MTSTRETTPRLAILGAGPAGLDAALAAAERGWAFTLYEAADEPAANVRSWGHVRLFSPWSIDASPRMRRALANGGRSATEGVPDGDDCPTGRELAETLLDRVAALPAVAPHLRLGTPVLALGREGLLKHEEIGSPERAGRRFRLLVREPAGREAVEHADAVLDCTGSLACPNPLGDGGIPAPGESRVESEAEAAIVRRIPDVAAEAPAWAGRTTLLVGGGHSAWTAARDLARLAEGHAGTRVVWALRCREVDWRVPDDPLPARDRLAEEAEALARGASPAVAARLGVAVESLERVNGAVRVTLRATDGGLEAVTADRVLALTGSVGDHRLYRQLQVHECYASGAPMKLSAALLGAGGDCMAQGGHGAETLLNPEPRFFILGAKSYGRNSAYLMRIGWQQVDDAFGLLARSFAG